MKITIQLVIETEGTTSTVVEDVASFTRANLAPDTLGLQLAEAKHLLQSVQETLVTEQVTEYLTQHQHCADCGVLST